MNTEDETFRKLKQTPFAELFDQIRNNKVFSSDAITNILNRNHWTFNEYTAAMSQLFTNK